MKSVTIAVDAMGGDNSPEAEVEGAVLAARTPGVSIILVGDAQRIEQELRRYDTSNLSLEVRHTTQVVGMNDSASDAVRKKKDSSIRVAFDLIKNGEAQAVVSSGNSGATMAAGMFVVKRISGIERPAIATIMPARHGEVLILDAGGNVDCRPSHLEQFAIMGAVYARNVMGISAPRIGLLSNGAEEKKGNELTRTTHTLLKRHDFNYIGYVEGRDVYSGAVDVVVCDGFVGNIVLKISEGLAASIGSMLREELQSRFWARIGYLLARPAFRAFKRKIDCEEYGGAPLLGIRGTCIICHGSSSPKSLANAIGQAAESVLASVNDDLILQLDKLSGQIHDPVIVADSSSKD
ncbi:MAG: phosphate acyltransferase PlsX [Desulfuromonadaceae bacterium]|nr:phosphate acyltransferase PlsX [Desulfuromonadaceae bacterium]